jgi:hypothetical protein
MAFTFERIKAGDPVQSTEEYKRAVEIGYGLPKYTRMVDVERDTSLYCISVNSNDERPPGKYLLFHKHSLIVIYAYQDYKRINVDRVATVFRIVSIDIPSELKNEIENIHPLIHEALSALGLSGEIPSPQVIIEFENC